MIYGSETGPLLADVVLNFESAKMQILRWMCGVSMKDKNTSLRKLIEVEPIITGIVVVCHDQVRCQIIQRFCRRGC